MPNPNRRQRILERVQALQEKGQRPTYSDIRNRARIGDGKAVHEAIAELIAEGHLRSVVTFRAKAQPDSSNHPTNPKDGEVKN
jgi:hypothetical protein